MINQRKYFKNLQKNDKDKSKNQSRYQASGIKITEM